MSERAFWTTAGQIYSQPGHVVLPGRLGSDDLRGGGSEPVQRDGVLRGDGGSGNPRRGASRHPLAVSAYGRWAIGGSGVSLLGGVAFLIVRAVMGA